MTGGEYKPITIAGFNGMNNIQQEGRLGADNSGNVVATPRVILNADVVRGELVKRLGKTIFAALPNVHSLWSDRLRVMLCASDGYLYRCYPDKSTIQICPLPGSPNEKLDYESADNIIYISKSDWCVRFNPETNTVSPWGIPIPEQPMLLSSNGSLSAGTYRVCYTAMQDGMIGGNSAIAEIQLGDGQGITLVSRPGDCIAWATEANGGVFYRAGMTDKIVMLNNVEVLPTFMCSPPKPMTNIRQAFGRMWGVVDNQVVYSEPYRYDLYKCTNVFNFPDKPILLAVTKGGIYVGFDTRIIFLAGVQPDKMTEQTVGGGVSKGTLAYVNNVPSIPGDKIPVWVAKEGIVAGSHSGELVNLTKDVVRFIAGDEGAAIARTVDGQSQYLAGFKSPPPGERMGFGDSATCDVVRKGTVLM